MVLPLPQSPAPAVMALPQGQPSPLPLIPDGILPPPPALGAFGQMDPLAMLGDPAILMALLDLIAEQQELQHGPVYEPWYRPGDYPKPKAQDITTKARADQQLYQLLIQRIRADRKVLLLLDVGKFKDADDVEVTFQDSSLAHDVALVVNLIAGCDLNYEARARTLEEAAIAEKKEQFAHAFRETQLRRHARMYGTSLAYDEAKFAVGTGHLCYRLCLDFGAGSDEIPVKADLLDPATCFPTWDGERGLATMTRVYSEPVGTVCSTWDRDAKGKVRDQLLSAKVADEVKGGERYRTLDDQVEVIEYWDRRWYRIVAAGVDVVSVEHKFGFVPFVYLRSPFGDAGPASLAALQASIGTVGGMAQLEIAAKGLSHIWASKTTHSQREAILGRMMTELKKTANPDRTFEQTANRYGTTPQVTNAEGGISLLLMGEEREVPGPPKPGLSLVPPLFAAVNEANQRGLLPASAYGVTSNANQSGTAMEGMNESGRDKVTPWLTMLQDADRECAEMALRLVRDWGHLLGSDGERGTFYIERRKPRPDQDQTITLTPEELRRTGVRIRSKRTSLRLSNIGNLGNAYAVLKQNGWVEDETVLEALGVQDPLAALERIQIQEFKKSPEYVKVMLPRWMREQGLVAEAAMVEQLIMQTQQASQPMPGQMPGMEQGMGAGPGSPPGMPQGPQGAVSGAGAMGLPSRLAGPPPDMGGVPPGSLA